MLLNNSRSLLILLWSIILSTTLALPCSDCDKPENKNLAQCAHHASLSNPATGTQTVSAISRTATSPRRSKPVKKPPPAQQPSKNPDGSEPIDTSLSKPGVHTEPVTAEPDNTGTGKLDPSWLKPFGFAAAVTGIYYMESWLIIGGGEVPCQVPADIHELESLLTDQEARCIHLDKTYDFVGSQGKSKMPACKPDFDKCGDAGQIAIDYNGWCGKFPRVPDVTVDTAGLPSAAIMVQSSKTIRGINDQAVIKGRGLLLFHVKNVIIQNVRFTDMNPQYVFGGDAVALKDTDLVWIDHCSFDNIGRQMLVTGREPIGKVTISFNEFNGVTQWSASCNNHHYWALLFYGQTGSITFAMNYITNTSGRGPEVCGPDSGGSRLTIHAVGNHYHQVDEAFIIGKGAQVLAYRNTFIDVLRPSIINPKSPGTFLIAENVLTTSGQLTGQATTDVALVGWDHLDTSAIMKIDPVKWAGIGRI